MPERLSNTELIALAQEVAVRQVTTVERGNDILKLATMVRLQVVWRTTIYSHEAAASIWEYLTNNGIDMEVVIAMTGEFMARAEQTSLETLSEILARTIGWPKVATAVPETLNALAGTVISYTVVLQANPWLVFLYLLSLSDVIQYLDARLPKNAQTVPKGLKKGDDQ